MLNFNIRRVGAPMASALIVAFSGCGGGAPRLASPQGAAGFSAIRAGLPATLHPAAGSSWMRKGLQGDDLLYVSDIGAESVDVFTYPDLKQAGALTGLSEPNGLCVDAAGDVFVLNTYAADILEYAHGGTEPIATLKQFAYSSGCAVNRKTGDLAVANMGGPNFTSGSVAIFKHARGSPTTYKSDLIYIAYFCDYDTAGNLYIDGFTSDGPTTIAELVKGSDTIKTVYVDGGKRLGWPGGVQWHAGYLEVGDQDVTRAVPSAPYPNLIYQLRVAGQRATIVSTTPLAGGGDVVQSVIEGKAIIGPDAQNDDVGFWRFPAGGKKTHALHGFYEPVAAVISPSR